LRIKRITPGYNSPEPALVSLLIMAMVLIELRRLTHRELLATEGQGRIRGAIGGAKYARWERRGAINGDRTAA
jgi:hypothetical protein